MDTVEPLPFSLEVDAQEERTVFRLAGELDMATAPQLEEALRTGEHENASEIVFDLRDLSFLDSMGLSALLRARAAGRDGHRKVSFVRGGDVVRRSCSSRRWTIGWTGSILQKSARKPSRRSSQG